MNNIPLYNPGEKVFDCTNTSMDKRPDGECDILFVVEPLNSMTYYTIEKSSRELKGIRAEFDSSGKLVPLVKNASKTSVIIQTDGIYRPIIAINAQMPGPTIIAEANQKINVKVYNELKNVEGISIHWHGMHQVENSEQDGVASITQHPIQPFTSYTYRFKAFPTGTHWYHAHSGAQRTDGLYGALIVEDIIPNEYDHDFPHMHTLMLMDWQKEASIDIFYPIGSSLNFWKRNDANDPPFEKYETTYGPDNTQLGPVPFWSGIINDKGRHYNISGNTSIPATDLNYFNVDKGESYRFRLIGAQALYPFKFSIQEHKLTVIATDGAEIQSIPNVNYVIVNTGERYDIVVNANNTAGNYWILAESLEDESCTNCHSQIFNNPINTHRAEAVLHYNDHPSRKIDSPPKTWDDECNSLTDCIAVNCPFTQYKNNMTCRNANSFRSKNHKIPSGLGSLCKDTLFYSFGFHGEKTTGASSVDGVNFRFPTYLPQLEKEYSDFSIHDKCPRRGCNQDHCVCTQVIDITDCTRYRQAIEMVIVNRDVGDNANNPESAHPVHLHGHSFYVVDIGYPQYNETTGEYQSANNDITCKMKTEKTDECSQFITMQDNNDMDIQKVTWKNNSGSSYDETILYARKDTVIVPYGGYTIIRFVVDNPGWWFFHCHIEVHQLEGMAAVVKELQLPSKSSGML